MGRPMGSTGAGRTKVPAAAASRETRQKEPRNAEAFRKNCVLQLGPFTIRGQHSESTGNSGNNGNTSWKAAWGLALRVPGLPPGLQRVPATSGNIAPVLREALH